MKLKISAKIRKEKGKKLKTLRKRGVLPAVLYGPKIKNLDLEIEAKEFEKILEKAGESSLISLELKDEKLKDKEFLVLIHDVQRDPLTQKPIHVDFYQPILKEKIEAKIPIIFEGEAPAVKEFGGTLVKNISEIEVRATPQNLPREIKVNISNLKKFEDAILVSDLKLPKGVEVKRAKDEVIARVLPPEKMEEEIVKPVEEKIEEAGKVEEKKEKEEETK
jgi:large subunit ribosomal protein L25